MFAWILKTKPENVGASGASVPADVDARRAAAAPASTKRSRNGSTPKLVIALPKNTGVSSPAQEALAVERVAGVVEQLELVA